MDAKSIKLDIFKAVISVGSNEQKNNWKRTAESVYEWIEGKDTEKSPSSKSSR